MNMKKNSRGLLFLLGAIAVLAVLVAFSVPPAKTENVSLSQVIDEAKTGKLDRIVVEGDKLTATLKDTSAPQQVTTKDSSNASLISDYGINPNQVTIATKQTGNSSIWSS